MARFYITTAIDYANGEPHLGHAYEKVGADAIARYHRLRGDDVWFLIGMDEHGQKVAQAAASENLTPQELVDRVALQFEAMWQRLSLSHDQFIRTTAEAHKAGVVDLIERIFDRNPDDFYEHSYRGRYCVGCEAFKQDNEITDDRCSLHPTRTLEWVEERNWFFRLSRYRDFLLELIEGNREFVQPESRRNEILALLRQGLDDISASRSRFTWGVPFPRPTSQGEQQTTYVWFDALPNYWTATRAPESRAEWPAQMHVIGKDITRFHCVIWPAMLQSAGLPLPQQVWAHGFVYFKGERLSKSAGTKLDLGEAIDRFGPDAFRYYLLREIPWDSDGSFTWDRFVDLYTSDLADGLGNLVSRSLAMLAKYRDGKVPEAPETSLDQAGVEAIHGYEQAMNCNDLRGAAEAAWRIVTAANQYIVQTAPWALAKGGKDEELDAALASLARCLYRMAVLVSPLMPAKAEELWSVLGQDGSAATADWASLASPPVTGTSTRKPDGLFPRPEPTASS